LSRRVRRWSATAAATAIAIATGAVLLAQDAAWTAHLAGVEASGSKRIPVASVATIAALKLGTTIGPKDVDAARQRLLATGLFRGVGYRFRNAGYSVIVTFTLEDVDWKTPVVFDNFVDHTDAQLIAAVARDVPSFDGVSPDSEPVLKKIADVLERIARDAKDPGSVSYALILDKIGGNNHWRFRIDRTSGPLPVCSVTLLGIPEASQPMLADRKAALAGVDYSKDHVLKFAKETFAPLLPAPAAVKQVDVKRAAVSDACRRGVDVTVTIR